MAEVIARVVFLWEAVNTFGPQTPRTARLSAELRERGYQVDHLVLRTPAGSQWFKEAPLDHATVLFPVVGDPGFSYEAALPLALAFVQGATVLIGAHETGWSLFGGIAISEASNIPLVLPMLSDVFGVYRAIRTGNFAYESFRRSRALLWSFREMRNKGANSPHKKLERLYVSGAADVVMYPSKFVADSLKRRLAPTARTEFVQFFTPVTAPLANDPPLSKQVDLHIATVVRKIVVIGRVSGEKGQALALRAHARVVKRHPHRLVLVGPDQSDGRLEHLIDRLAVGATIDRVGHAEEPLTHLDETSALLIPSLSEGAPAALIEAILMNRVPIASTRVGYAAEYLPTDHLCRPASVASLVRVMNRLLKGEVPLLDAATVERVHHLHTFSNFVDVYDSVIRRYIARHVSNSQTVPSQ